MRLLFFSAILISLLLAGCKKYEQTHEPVSGTYILKGTSALFSVNGNGEQSGNHLIIVSGRGGVPYQWDAAHDTLFKSLWAGDKLSITSTTYTSIYYSNGSTQGFLVDSSANHTASITVSATGGN